MNEATIIFTFLLKKHIKENKTMYSRVTVPISFHAFMAILFIKNGLEYGKG